MSKKDEQLQLTTLAIREKLMEYYKGTCVERYTRNPELRLTEVPFESDGRVYRYQRQQWAIQNPNLLSIKYDPIGEVRKSPDTFTFYTSITQRSPELQQLQKNLEKFFKRYLGGIKLKYDDDKFADLAGSKANLLDCTSLRNGGSGPRASIDEFLEAQWNTLRAESVSAQWHISPSPVYDRGSRGIVTLTDDLPF